MKKKYWTLSIYQDDHRLACFTFDNIEDMTEKLSLISEHDEEIDHIEIDVWHESI